MTKIKPFISPAITDVPLRQTLQSIIDNSSSDSVIVGNGPPPASSAVEGTSYYDASSDNLFIFNKGVFKSLTPKLGQYYSFDVGSTDVSALDNTAVVFYWFAATQETDNEIRDPSDGEVLILLSTTGSFTYVFNGSDDVKKLSDGSEIDVNSWGKQASYVLGDQIISGTLSSEKVRADFINTFSINASLIDAGTISASRLNLNGNAAFVQGGGISFNKPNATSENNGLFFGSTSSQAGSDDFTFYASNAGTGSNDDRRSIKITKDELTLVNPTIQVGNAGTEVELYDSGDSDRIYTATETINKGDNFAGGSGDWNGYDIIKIVLVGGGGGGGARAGFGSAGSAGDPTQVTLNKTSGSSTFTAAGGAGGAAGTNPVSNGAGEAGEDGPINPHGSTSSGGAGGTVTYNNGSNGSGRGSGGGGGGGRNPGGGYFGVSSVGGGKGGKAGAMTVTEIDASLLNSITINSIGSGGTGGGNSSSAGNGRGGLVKLFGATIDLSTVNLSNLSNPSFNAIGTYAFGRSSTTKAAGQTLAGSNITASNSDEVTGGTTLTSGTWRCMGKSTNDANATLWVRIS